MSSIVKTAAKWWGRVFLFVCYSQVQAAPGGKVISANLRPLDQQIIHLGNGSELRELDPATAAGTPESRIIDNLFEGLTTLDAYTLEPRPGMAKAWEISADGKTYTFSLRPEAKWSDGTPLTAHDFVKSWQRALAPETASEYAYQLYYIKNGEEFNTGKLKDPKLLGVEAKDPLTLVVTLNNPTAYFLRLTAFHTLHPTPAHVIAKYPEKAWTKAEHMVSNGPFKLVEWKLNSYVKVVPNEHYWDRGRIKIKEAYFHPIENQDTEEKSFFAGELHQTYDVPVIKVPTYQREIAKNPAAYHPFRIDPFLATYFYRFNTTRKPFNDPRVRKAFALTVDRQLLVDRVTRRGELPGATYTPPHIAGYTYQGKAAMPTSVTPEVQKQAKALLAEAGYPDGKGFPKVELLYNTSENHKRIAVAIQQMWKKYLGVEVGIYNQEWKVYLNNQKNLEYDISRAAWVGDYPDPNTFLNMFVTGGGQNQTGWSNKDYDALIDQAEKTSDQKQRFALFEKAEELLLSELPILPIYIYTRSHLTSEKLKMINEQGEITDWVSNIADRAFLKNFVLIQ